MKLKAQIELLEYREAHYTKKYVEIDQEEWTEIKELCSTITQQCLLEQWKNILQKYGIKNTSQKYDREEKSSPKWQRNILEKKGWELIQRNQHIHINVHTKNLHRHITKQRIDSTDQQPHSPSASTKKQQQYNKKSTLIHKTEHITIHTKVLMIRTHANTHKKLHPKIHNRYT